MSIRTVFARNSLCVLKVQRSKAGGNIEFVRYRKPRFEPRAASKIFRVKEPRTEDPVEVEVMKTWTNHYNTSMKSLRAYLYEKNQVLKQFQKESELSDDVQYEMKLSDMRKKNDEFNLMSSQLRLKDEKEKEEIDIIKKEKMILREEKEKQEMREEAERRAAFEVEKFEQYVLPSNVDSHLERLLNTRSDYNFAITQKGRRRHRQGEKDSSREEVVVENPKLTDEPQENK